jgi:hypothetical protein
MTRQVSTLNVLASSQQTKAIKANNNMVINRLIINDEHDITRIR